ncbi:uncharacterized protein LOC128581774 isoform X2 [Nycticebus coucang]|uniref:uncharacterized protein LOC128581774 isoform X2 n=1 Tax=Nycticebus coucang TaxID=9470 RepID=UPI00234CEF3D|nr:uncharacterized protein LOC128581774 isoform X2 [Nycticebus coucang]
MLGLTAHSPGAGPGGEPHSLTLRGTDCASFSAPPRTIPSLPLPASAGADPLASRVRPYAVACLPSSTGTPPASGRGALIRTSFTFPPPESCREALPASGAYSAAKRKCDTQRVPAPGRSACAGGGGNAGSPAGTEKQRPNPQPRPEAAAGSRRFATTLWKAVGAVATKLQEVWRGFLELAEQVTRTRIWLASHDTDEFILPTGANKTRGRFELAFFTIGGCCMTGAAFGAVNGLRLGLKETQNMAWSKPRNVQILNMVTRQGALWANTLGSLALLYSAFGVIIEKTRGAEDDLNTVAAGTMTGMLYKCTGGLRGVARGGLAGLTLTSLYALYNNWEHMKGSFLQQSL